MTSHGIPRTSGTGKSSGDSKQKEQKQIKEYRQLVDEIKKKIKDNDFTSDTFDLTTKLLTRNPEYYTIWNQRRRIYLKGLFPSIDSVSKDSFRLDPQAKAHTLILDDLNFLLPLLRKFPKCYWIWNHRLWLLQQSTQRTTKAQTRVLWEKELLLVSKMLALDSRNFLGWGYRRTVVSWLEKFPQVDKNSNSESDAVFDDAKKISLTEQELNYTTKMIHTNLSNFSAWHSRSILLPRLLYEQKADKDRRQMMWDEEIELIHTALYTDPYDSSLWAYHNALFEMLIIGPSTTTILAEVSTSSYTSILESELEVINDLLEDTKDCKWIYEALIRLGLRLQKLRQDKLAAVNLNSAWQELIKLDPLRSGRWNEWAKQLDMAV